MKTKNSDKTTKERLTERGHRSSSDPGMAGTSEDPALHCQYVCNKHAQIPGKRMLLIQRCQRWLLGEEIQIN